MIETPRQSAPPAARPLASLAIVCLAVTVIVMDGSIVNVALPTLGTALGEASSGQLQWIVDAYVLAFATLLLVMGAASDRLGRRRVLVAGLLVFGACSAAAAAATTPTDLIVRRALMGVGAAMIFPTTLAILTAAFPCPARRRVAIGAWAACSGLGVAIGPVVGGWLLVHGHWSWIFLVNVPVVGLGVAGAWLFVDESREPRPERFDVAGHALAVAALVALVWGLIEGPERGWLDPLVLVPLALSGLLALAFARCESRAERPMLGRAVAGDRRFLAACLAIGVAFFGLFGFVFMVTQYFQLVRGHGPLEAGLRTLPFAAFILVGAGAAAGLGRRRSPRSLCTVGLLAMGGGFAWAARDTIDAPYDVLVGQMALLGTGLGLVSASATDVIMGLLPPERFGLGSSVNDTAREVGGAIGVAVLGSAASVVYRGELAADLAASPLPEPVRDAIGHSLGGALLVADRVTSLAGPAAGDAVRSAARDAFMHGFRTGALLAAVAAGLGAALVVLSFPHRARVAATPPVPASPSLSAAAPASP